MKKYAVLPVRSVYICTCLISSPRSCISCEYFLPIERYCDLHYCSKNQNKRGAGVAWNSWKQCGAREAKWQQRLPSDDTISATRLRRSPPGWN